MEEFKTDLDDFRAIFKIDNTNYIAHIKNKELVDLAKEIIVNHKSHWEPVVVITPEIKNAIRTEISRWK